ncbi:MAG TPA: hypothetical protein VF599_13390 [Pyrinomonadaceae bacterium]|jgi:hypothetical protein
MMKAELKINYPALIFAGLLISFTGDALSPASGSTRIAGDKA